MLASAMLRLGRRPSTTVGDLHAMRSAPRGRTIRSAKPGRQALKSESYTGSTKASYAGLQISTDQEASMGTDVPLPPCPDMLEHGGQALLLRDARSTNLYMAQAIRLGLELDLVGTCLRYGLNAEHGHRLLAFTPQVLGAKVASIGNQSLFLPRRDLLELLDAPDELRATLAAARPAAISTDSPA
jgi:hypothetical protein